MSTPIEADGNELRAKWKCEDLAEIWGLEARPAYDADGHPTGWVAVDPDALEDWFAEHYEEDEQ